MAMAMSSQYLPRVERLGDMRPDRQSLTTRVISPLSRCGQAVGVVKKIQPAADIVREIEAEVEGFITRLAQ